uniref:(northern house mosquito) hypothetical protein n=1 Tax=Culex pipiens TaxID=7175 RepID=A0A8D8KJE6_CULPI
MLLLISLKIFFLLKLRLSLPTKFNKYLKFHQLMPAPIAKVPLVSVIRPAEFPNLLPDLFIPPQDFKCQLFRIIRLLPAKLTNNLFLLIILPLSDNLNVDHLFRHALSLPSRFRLLLLNLLFGGQIHRRNHLHRELPLRRQLFRAEVALTDARQRRDAPVRGAANQLAPPVPLLDVLGRREGEEAHAVLVVVPVRFAPEDDALAGHYCCI